MGAVTLIQQILTGVFLALAAMFFVATALGMYRFVTVYGRLHASGKCLTGGVISVIVAAMIYFGETPVVARLAIAAILLLFTSSMGSHALARAAHGNRVDVDRLQDDAYARAREPEDARPQYGRPPESHGAEDQAHGAEPSDRDTEDAP